MRILVLNGGSSTFKCWLGDLSGDSLPVAPPQPVWEAHVDLNRQSTIAEVLQTALKPMPAQVEVVGHRIVHGGAAYHESTLITPEVRKAIAQEAEIAPAHNRFELAAIETVDRVLGPDTLQIAVFDASFHSTLEPAAYVYPGPYAWLEQGIRRFGFHGISYQYAVRRAADILKRDVESLRLIICHLGNGASLAAVRNGKSVDTTMGFTPLEGLMMGSRCGSIDPGIIVYLIRHCGYSAEQLDHILNQESGLLGVSGISEDMREILKAMAQGNQRAQLAFDIYAHRLCREVGAMLVVLGGSDALVFTGGVGEHCPPLRQVVSRQLEFLGLKLDGVKNAATCADDDIAAQESAMRVLVIHAEEEWEIARECYRLISNRGKSI